MAQVCKGFCEDYQAEKTMLRLKYAEGQKRCTLCALFIKYDGDRCPCCRSKLRTKPRNSSKPKKVVYQ
ncbi:hypothetical protein C6988_04760 [Nitrosopumilus sp. b1]|uniref:hypothetical protein n=1 Tax=Nitrosopumilus sp. b1 TaxID=2109907 RepID=UPI0015F3E963|nr:hypothetical protein [Nitrosopumilus sp. b1]KAF6243169.1 hypothetical protein C6988_04760 [Nitrosopumilus sp. b1]